MFRAVPIKHKDKVHLHGVHMPRMHMGLCIPYQMFFWHSYYMLVADLPKCDGPLLHLQASVCTYASRQNKIGLSTSVCLPSAAGGYPQPGMYPQQGGMMGGGGGRMGGGGRRMGGGMGGGAGLLAGGGAGEM